MGAWWWGWLLSTVGLTVLWLAGNGRRSAWALGMAIQVLWATYALKTDQPGFLLSVVGYGFVHARNWWKWRDQSPRQELSPQPSECEPKR